MPRLTNPNVTEVISYNNLHVDEFTIRHARSTKAPPRNIIIRATAYGTNSKGDRVYDPQTYEEEIADFDPILLQEWCQKNQKSLTEALTKIQQYKVELATKLATGEIDELYLLVAVELGVAKVIEMMGIYDLVEIN